MFFTARANRVEHAGACPLEKITVLLDQDTLEPSLKERAHAPVGAVDVLAVDPVQLSHAFGKIGWSSGSRQDRASRSVVPTA